MTATLIPDAVIAPPRPRITWTMLDEAWKAIDAEMAKPDNRWGVAQAEARCRGLYAQWRRETRGRDDA